MNAAEATGTTDVDAVRSAMYGQEFPNLTGGTAVMLPNHHLAKPVLIDEIRAEMAIVLVEQYFSFAYELGDAFYVLERGALRTSGRKDTLEAEALRRMVLV